MGGVVIVTSLSLSVSLLISDPAVLRTAATVVELLPGLVDPLVATENPGLSVIPKDLVLLKPNFLGTLLFDQHANLLLYPLY